MHRKPDKRNRAKHQHWAPQFYLRHFATTDTQASDEPKVWIFSKNASDDNEVLTNVRNVCGKRYPKSSMSYLPLEKPALVTVPESILGLAGGTRRCCQNRWWERFFGA